MRKDGLSPGTGQDLLLIEKQKDHKAHYAQSGTASAAAPGAQGRCGGIAAGLNFLSFVNKEPGARLDQQFFEVLA